MKHSIYYLICILFLTIGCNSNRTGDFEEKTHAIITKNVDEVIVSGETIEDGFYLILNEYNDADSIASTKNAVITYDHGFLDDNTADQPIFLEVLVEEFVPLTLKKEPESVEQDDQRINLLLSMTDSSGFLLEKFTEKYLNRKTCIVIGGKAVTMHKIREKITEGRLQISRCTDNACKYLLLELNNNVVNE